MTLPTEPLDFKWFGIIGVVHLRSGMSTPETGFWNQMTALFVNPGVRTGVVLEPLFIS
jgi:hypothetical protein